MRTIYIVVVGLLGCALIAGCSAAVGVSAPNPDRPPALRAATSYSTHTTERIVDGPQQAVKTWLEETRLVTFMEPTQGIPGVVSTTPISGTWGEDGALRYANLDNGHTAIDRIIQNRDPDLFHYQIFGFTAPSRYVVNHIVGRLEYEAVSTRQTRITWSYAIAPTSLITAPFAASFLSNRIVPFMENTMDNMAAAAPF